MKRNTLSLISMILGIISTIFLISVLLGNFSPEMSSTEELGTTLAILIILPSIAAIIVAVILNIIGYIRVSATLTLISAIFYTLSFIFMPLWGFMGIPSLILQFIAFKKIKDIQKSAI